MSKVFDRMKDDKVVFEAGDGISKVVVKKDSSGYRYIVDTYGSVDVVDSFDDTESGVDAKVILNTKEFGELEDETDTLRVVGTVTVGGGYNSVSVYRDPHTEKYIVATGSGAEVYQHDLNDWIRPSTPKEVVFVNDAKDGSVTVKKDEKTGKYSVNTTGDVDVNGMEIFSEYYSARGISNDRGTLFIDGDLNTDIIVAGDVEVTGYVDGNITASGYIKCGKNISSKSKIEPNTTLGKECDIVISRGSLRFTGDVWSSDGKRLDTNGMVEVGKYGFVTLLRDISIVTDSVYAFYFGGDVFQVFGGLNIYALSNNDNGYGVFCYGTGVERTFYVQDKSKLRAYGKRVGVCVETGTKMVVDDESALDAKGETGIRNLGMFGIYNSSKIDATGDINGIYNKGPKAKFYVFTKSEIDAQGKKAGLLSDMTGIDADGEADEFVLSSGTIFRTSDIVYTTLDEIKPDINSSDCDSDDKKQEYNIKAHICIDGDVYIDNPGIKNLSWIGKNVTIKGTGKLYLNNTLKYDGSKLNNNTENNDPRWKEFADNVKKEIIL